MSARITPSGLRRFILRSNTTENGRYGKVAKGKGKQLHKVVDSPVGDLKVLRKITSLMTLKEIKLCIRSLKAFKVQKKTAGVVSPYWVLCVQNRK